VAKNRVIKNQHAIAYYTKDEPLPQPNEHPRIAREKPMLPGIRVKPKERQYTLDRMARIDFSRIYTVEHNVKVFDFGNVHRDHLPRLITQWVTVFAAEMMDDIYALKNSHQQLDLNKYDHNDDDDEDPDGNEDDQEDEDDEDDYDDDQDNSGHKKPTYSSRGHYPGGSGYVTTPSYSGTNYPPSNSAASTQGQYPTSQYTRGTYGSSYDSSQQHQQAQYQTHTNSTSQDTSWHQLATDPYPRNQHASGTHSQPQGSSGTYSSDNYHHSHRTGENYPSRQHSSGQNQKDRSGRSGEGGKKSSSSRDKSGRKRR
jgi:uncharacterized protein DUF6590